MKGLVVKPRRKTIKLARGNKFGAIKTIVDGITFDSKWEAERYQQLQLRVKAGDIVGLRLQVPYPCMVVEPDGCIVTIGKYLADFVYTDINGIRVIEDTKGKSTDMFRWKKKHVEAQYGIEILEVRKPKKRRRR